jgi:hypothetical protein
VGIIVLTFVFLAGVRWWSDILGRLIAGVLVSLSSVLAIIIVRQLGVELPGGILIWRAAVFCIFGLAVWTALGTFVWAQYGASRIQRKRMTTRKERKSDEEADLAGSRHDRDGSPDSVPGSHR